MIWSQGPPPCPGCPIPCFPPAPMLCWLHASPPCQLVSGSSLTPSPAMGKPPFPIRGRGGKQPVMSSAGCRCAFDPAPGQRGRAECRLGCLFLLSRDPYPTCFFTLLPRLLRATCPGASEVGSTGEVLTATSPLCPATRKRRGKESITGQLAGRRTVLEECAHCSLSPCHEDPVTLPSPSRTQMLEQQLAQPHETPDLQGVRKTWFLPWLEKSCSPGLVRGSAGVRG